MVCRIHVLFALELNHVATCSIAMAWNMAHVEEGLRLDVLLLLVILCLTFIYFDKRFLRYTVNIGMTWNAFSGLKPPGSGNAGIPAAFFGDRGRLRILSFKEVLRR